MPVLRHHLAATPVHDLRRITSRLGLLTRSLQRKTELIDVIVEAWGKPETRAFVLSALSPAARGALAHLLRVARTPSALFFAEYGAIRHARTFHAADSPWRSSLSVSEELYYFALIAAFDLKPIRTASYLCLPDDLNLEQALEGKQPAAATLDAIEDDDAYCAGLPVWTTAYDVAQWLILLYEQSLYGEATATASRTRWPALHTMQQLNQRLASPERQPFAQAPSRRNRLRLILFLADAAGLHEYGVLTPLGWTWLAELPEQQTALLWRAWLDASPLIRRQYAFADGLIPHPWPLPLLRAIKSLATRDFSAAELTEHMLQQEQLSAQFWRHQVDSLSALRRLVARVMNQVFAPFGIVRSQRGEHGVLYALTPLGAHLLGTRRAQQLAWQPSAVPTLQAVGADRTWRISAPPTIPFRTQADLAAYAVHVETRGVPPHVVQYYQIDDASLARAISTGFRWPGLAATLERLALPVDSVEYRQLADRFAHIPTLGLRTRTLLVAEDRDALRELLEHPVLRPLIDNLLSAATATLKTTPDEASRRLRAAGYAVRSDEMAAASATASSSQGALWLAGSIYRYLAAFLPLPMPLQPSQLDDLIADLTPVQRSTLSASLEKMETALLELLDGRIYAPPAFTVDVAAHRLRLETAAAQRQPLYIDYFSPGRNLLTRRPIEPYWIEQVGQQLYVRAECLLSGRILLFRLDRIRAIWDTPPEQPSTE